MDERRDRRAQARLERGQRDAPGEDGLRGQGCSQDLRVDGEALGAEPSEGLRGEKRTARGGGGRGGRVAGGATGEAPRSGWVGG